MKLLSTLWHFLPLIICLGLLGWLLYSWLKKSDAPGALVTKWVLTGLILAALLGFGASANDPITKVVAVLFAAVCGLMFAILWVPSMCEFVGRQIGSLYDGGDLEIEPEAFYSIAEAKRKRGKYHEAIAEIRKQLASFPEDFRGWMLLAEIQAENLDDIAGAQEIVERVLAQEGHTPKNIAYALSRVADWHLRFRQHTLSARDALERIVALFPDTEFAVLAQQRIAHLGTDANLAERKEPVRIQMKRYETNIGLKLDPVDLDRPQDDPEAAARDLVRHLDDYPQDSEARENLAILYANHYQRLDMAMDQLEQLITTPNQPQKQVVHWLNLLADLQIKVGGSIEAGRESLQRVVDLFPKSAAAENALSRMAHLKLEMRPQLKSQPVKLGVYEQNLGLKEKSKSLTENSQSGS